MNELSPLDKAIEQAHRRVFEKFQAQQRKKGTLMYTFLKSEDSGVRGAQSLLAATAAGWKGSRNAQGKVINEHPEYPGHELEVNHDGSWAHHDEDGTKLESGDDAESLADHMNDLESREADDRKHKTRKEGESEDEEDRKRAASMHETDEGETYDETGRKLSDEEEEEEERKQRMRKQRVTKGQAMQRSLFRNIFFGPDDTLVTKSTFDPGDGYDAEGHNSKLMDYPIQDQEGTYRPGDAYPGGRATRHAVEATDAAYRDAVMTRLGNMRLVIQNPYVRRDFSPLELGSGPDPFLHGDGPLTLSAPEGERRTRLLPAAGPGRRTDRPGAYEFSEPDADHRGPEDEDLSATGYPDVFFGPSNPLSRYNYAPASTRAGMAHIGGVPVAVSKRASVKRGLFSNIVYGD